MVNKMINCRFCSFISVSYIASLANDCSMPKPAFDYFFTAQDNDFILKGARDPLGFQIIWQNTARQLIPYLNTVCGNLRDWQILCLGHALYASSCLSEDIIPFLSASSN